MANTEKAHRYILLPTDTGRVKFRKDPLIGVDGISCKKHCKTDPSPYRRRPTSVSK